MSSVDKVVKKLAPSYIASGDMKWCSHFRKQFGSSQNVNHRATVLPSILLLAIHPREINEYFHMKICT